MSWNIKTPGDYINGPLTVTGSATITGDLTVDTNVLKVDTTNNVVGIGTSTPNSFAFNGPAELVVANNAASGDYCTLTVASGSTGRGYLAFANGSSGTNRYNGSILYDHTSNYMAFQTTAGAEQMRLNSTGLGVGVSNFAYRLNAAGFIAAVDPGFTGTGGSLIGAMLNNDNAAPGLDIRRWTGSAGIHGTTYISTDYTGNTYFYNGQQSSNTKATSLKMTLDASGSLLINTGTNIGAAKLRVHQTGTNNGIYISGDYNTPLVNFCNAGYFRSDGSYLSLQTNSAGGIIYITPNTGGVYISPGNTSWTANSDERLKDIIEPISNAVAKVGSLRSVIGKWKTDPDGIRRSFLIAQDAETVFPEVVDKNADGMLGIRYSEVIPLLVAAIKELTARVQTIETR